MKNQEETTELHALPKYEVGDKVHIDKERQDASLPEVQIKGQSMDISECFGVTTSITRVWTYAFPLSSGMYTAYYYECDVCPGCRIPENFLVSDDGKPDEQRFVECEVESIDDDNAEMLELEDFALYSLVKVDEPVIDASKTSLKGHVCEFLFKSGSEYFCVSPIDRYYQFIEENSNGMLLLDEITGIWYSGEDKEVDWKKVDESVIHSVCEKTGLELLSTEHVCDGAYFKVSKEKVADTKKCESF